MDNIVWIIPRPHRLQPPHRSPLTCAIVVDVDPSHPLPEIVTLAGLYAIIYTTI
jgi:hypothetical protein